MNRIRRTALLTGSALATLVFTLTAAFWPGRGGLAEAQTLRHQTHGHPIQAPSQAKAPSPTPSNETGPIAQPTGQAAAGTEAGSSAAPGAAAASPQPGAAAAATPSMAGDASSETGLVPSPDKAGVTPVMQIQGDYDIKQLRRLIQLAKESGFSKDQLRQITVEDENGHVVNALAFLDAYERAKKEKAARLAAEKAKVYLTPKDLIHELDEKQAKDLDKLRDKMVFVD